MKTLFLVAALLTLLLGVAWTLFPGAMFASWGVEANGLAVYMGRRYGGLFFGYAVILWLSRTSEFSVARTAILAGSAIVTVVMALVILVGVATGVVGPAVWGVVGIEVLLAGGFVYFYLTAGRQRPAVR